MVSRLGDDHAVCLQVGTPEAADPVRVRIAGAARTLTGELEAEEDWGGIVRSEQLAEIQVGDRVTFAEDLERLDGSRVRGPALDNRIGCLVLLRAVRALGDGVAFAWTVREETDQAGAIRAARTIEPELVISVDATYASDDDAGPDSTIRVGDGPAITLLDEGLVAHRPLVEAFAAAAAACGITWQREVVQDGVSEAGRIQSGLGIPSLPLLVAIENAHTDHEVADLRDVAAAIELLVGGLRELGA
jgi:endoglucanase